MKTIRLTCENGETDNLLTHLSGKVFHLTTYAAFSAIRKTGKILHNKDGQFNVNIGSKNSFGRLMGYVCLFDLQNHRPQVLERILFDYNFLGPSWFQQEKNGWIVSHLAYFILDSAYEDQIIPNSRAREHLKQTERYYQYIPDGEVWIENHVPLEWIETVILARVLSPAPARDSLASILRRLDAEPHIPNQ